MTRPEGGDAESQLQARAGRLRVDAGTAAVLRKFELAGVRAVLLKGPSTARWLYAEGEPRSYLDCDLLVAPASADQAAQPCNPWATGGPSTIEPCPNGGVSTPASGRARPTA